MKKLNCWEYQICSCDSNGNIIEKYTICTAVLAKEYDGINTGKNGGRVCWGVAGTFCEGDISCSIAEKIKKCLHCKFLKYVNDQEGREFVLLPI